MLDLVFWMFIFIVSIFVLIKASDYFTISAEKIGIFLGIPSFIVGVTIVSIGTSLPEIISSIIAVLKGSSEIVVGNVVGSNIANIFLIIGVSAVVADKLKASYEVVKVDLPFLISTAFLLTITVWDQKFTFGEGILSIAAFIIYILYTLSTREKQKSKEVEKDIEKDIAKYKRRMKAKPFIILAVSSLFIYIGAKYTIESVIQLSPLLNIGTEVIAITAVAFGTSLPELMVSVSAARKGNTEIAIGNVIGSNIFNATAVMGVPSMFGALIIPSSIISFALPLMLIATFIYLFMVQDKEITTWEGMLLIVFYVFFIGKIISVL